MKSLMLVCDDAGLASVDRGIRTLVEKTGKPVCADYLIEQAGAAERAIEMSANPLVPIGIHFELSGMSDAERVAITGDLKAHDRTLGEQPEIQERARADARRQLETFREALHRDPAHVSTHGNFNVDFNGSVMSWWHDLMRECFGETVPPMQLAIPHVRHNLYSWNLPETAQRPLTPEEFGAELRAQKADIVEFVMHPALPEPSDASIDMLFTAEMRIADLHSAILIVNSGIIGKSGYQIVAVETLRM